MNLYRRILERIDAGHSFALAIVLASDGSTPCKAGAKALMDEAGRITGTIGGGTVEAQAQRSAREVLHSGAKMIPFRSAACAR